jgi:hypothetical protein
MLTSLYLHTDKAAMEEYLTPSAELTRAEVLVDRGSLEASLLRTPLDVMLLSNVLNPRVDAQSWLMPRFVLELSVLTMYRGSSQGSAHCPKRRLAHSNLRSDSIARPLTGTSPGSVEIKALAY